MSTNAISKGMEVYSSDGQKVGTVGDTFSATPAAEESIGTPNSDVGAGVTGPTSEEDELTTSGESPTFDSVRIPVSSGLGAYNTGVGTTGFSGGAPGAIAASVDIGAPGVGATVTPSDTKYFEVKRGGILGIGGETLYVPFSAVESVAPGDNVTLACALDDCLSRYSERPAPISDEPPSDAG